MENSFAHFGDIALILFGPLSSASEKGQGPLFSWFFILVGGWVLFGAWTSYLKKRNEAKVPLFSLILVTGIALLFVVLGIRGVLQ
jgi:hypothetical protein